MDNLLEDVCRPNFEDRLSGGHLKLNYAAIAHLGRKRLRIEHPQTPFRLWNSSEATYGIHLSLHVINTGVQHI